MGGSKQHILGGQRLFRALKILQLIQSRRGLGPRDLASHLEVSVRTLYRDLETLNMAGVPIYCDQTGYRLAGDVVLIPPLQFEPAEALALLVSAGGVRGEKGGPFAEALGAAAAKVEAAIPSQIRQLVREATDRIRVDLQPLGSLEEHGEVFRTLEQAVLEGRRLTMTYFSLNRNATEERQVDPYRLLFRERAWYLVAFCHRRHDVRLFRLERIRAARLEAESFTIPADFDLDQYMQQAWTVERGDQPVEVALRLRGVAARLAEESEWHPSQRLERVDDDTVLMRVAVGSRGELARWVLGFAGQAEVLEPAVLRVQVAEMAAAALAVHRDAAGKAAQ